MNPALGDPASAPQRFGKYELVNELGHGGMAVVHRARYQGIGGFSRPVVIKRILPELAGEEPFVKMFVEEARLSALLDHPNIVQIHDFGVIDGSYFLAMEFIEGIPLHRFMRYYGRRRPAPPEAAAYVMQQVCVALQYAHSLMREGQALGIVHRDVSPANIMLSVHGAVKLLDFGIAKAAQAIDREETRTGTLKGKWSYMSPEQVVGQPVTARSDIFAAGIVLWEVLTGRRLFKAKTDFLTLSNVVQARVAPVTNFRPDLPDRFNEICARALARRPRDRYESAEQMADDLEEVLTDHPFSPTILATMVAEVQIETDATTEEEISGAGSASASTSASTSNSSSGGRIETHASRRLRLTAPDLLQRKPWLLPAVMVAAALAVLALALVHWLLPAPRRVHSTTAGSGSSAPRPPPAAPVRVQAFSTPDGASVTVAGESRPRGVTPFTLELPRSSTRVKMIASLAGHRPDEKELAPSEDRMVLFRLRPLKNAVPDRGVAPVPAPDDEGKKAEEKPARPVKKAAVSKPDRPPPVAKKPAIKKPAIKAVVKKPAAKPARKPAAKAGKKKELPNLKSGDLLDDPYR